MKRSSFIYLTIRENYEKCTALPVFTSKKKGRFIIQLMEKALGSDGLVSDLSGARVYFRIKIS